jgi:ketosteroid isomerase-like protein
MIRRALVLLLLLLPLLAFAADAPMTGQALRAQADAWDAAIVRKDREAIAANMSDSFMQIGSDGRAGDKAEFIEGILSDKLVIEPYTVEEFRVRFYGNTALITGRTDMHGSWEGKPFRSHYRFTDTYVREADGHWRVVNVQTTEVQEHR